MDTIEAAIVQDGVHNYSEAGHYVVPTDTLVRQKLEWFQDQKLALMMHWGPYSQLGLVESWALSEKDADWSRNDVDWDTSDQQFREEYFALNKTFNPLRFMPTHWADFAAENGFKYLIFTTKHHDGFCMWDTQFSDYKITDPSCPFHTHQKRDILKEVFNAFRAKGIGISAYFSKADWHTQTYWNDELRGDKPTSRGPSYSPEEHPELWQKFKTFTENQVLELCEHYGDIDILWFDAGWVCAQNRQDIELGSIVEKARKIQPGILSADRTVGGPYENYITPEQCVPDAPLGVPWESCITAGTSFSFKYEDEYKTPRELVTLLVDVVCKGGNLALNIGPQPDGRLPAGAIKAVSGLGKWLKQYGEAIYATRVCPPYKIGKTAFTQKNKAVYATRLYQEGEARPESILIPYTSQPVVTIEDLGTGRPLVFENTPDGLLVRFPLSNEITYPLADVFRLTTES